MGDKKDKENFPAKLHSVWAFFKKNCTQNKVKN